MASSFTQLLTSLLVSFLGYALYKLTRLIYKEFTSPFRNLPGPPSRSLFFGNFKDLGESKDTSIHDEWIREYGKVTNFTHFFTMSSLYTTDTRAVNHILTNSYTYQKDKAGIYNVKRILGPGVIFVEEDEHKIQRKILNPAFGPNEIRNVTEIFVDKATQLRDIWFNEISEQGGVARVDVLPGLHRMFLDVIGLAGFGYKFNALTEDPETNELNSAFSTLFKSTSNRAVLPLLQSLFRPLRLLPANGDAEAKQAREIMNRIGTQLLQESKAAMLPRMKDGKNFPARKDLLSLLVRANAASDLPESQRMSDESVLAPMGMRTEISTFLLAGHETSSSATTLGLFALAHNKPSQAKLREELSTLATDNPTMDELNELPYLDAVVREILRVYPPVPMSGRTAMRDDVLPLSSPVTDKKGRVHQEFRIRKGDFVWFPIIAMNRDKEIWGEDAMEFRPERWASIPEASNSIPGVWSNILTFLGGPRNCIGYRFAITEIKAVLYTLIRAFEFDPAVPAKDIAIKVGITQRPVLITDPKKPNQMPLLVRPVGYAASY